MAIDPNKIGRPLSWYSAPPEGEPEPEPTPDQIRERGIEAAVNEFFPVMLDLSRGDLQGICEARAINLLREIDPRFDVNDFRAVMDLSGEILELLDDLREPAEVKP